MPRRIRSRIAASVLQAGPMVQMIFARRGEALAESSGDERTVYAVARELADAGQVSQQSYEAARDLLGETGMVELVSLCGYYTLISYLLNAFAVPIPPGAQPMWSGE